jgi:hypothetical protein
VKGLILIAMAYDSVGADIFLQVITQNLKDDVRCMYPSPESISSENIACKRCLEVRLKKNTQHSANCMRECVTL